MTGLARPPVQHLLTLPPVMARSFETLTGRARPDWFATSDPEGPRLGSGGGTANLLAEAWRATGGEQAFDPWLTSSRKLLVHGGGLSRRLPAYAALGKPFTPIPVLRWSRGQRLDQTLLDLQLPDYRRLLDHAPASTVAMVASGDVLLRFGRELPPFPDADIVGLGMWVPADVAKDHGVFLCRRDRPDELACFLQKPDPERLAELSVTHAFLVDTGVWLLSHRAVGALMRKAGWDGTAFADSAPRGFELYAKAGLALGYEPTEPDPDLAGLSSAVAALPDAAFHHFGSSRQLIQSTTALQNLVIEAGRSGPAGSRLHPDVYQQNARVAVPLRLDRYRTIWVENSVVPATWELTSGHVLTGIPDNDWSLKLLPGTCLDLVPIGEDCWCVRPYGIDDPFAGHLGEAATRWLGAPVAAWLEARGVDGPAAGLAPELDIQAAPLFPVLDTLADAEALIDWMCAPPTTPEPAMALRWATCERLSAAALGERANLDRLVRQRLELSRESLRPMLDNASHNVLYQLDLAATADLYAASTHVLPEADTAEVGQDPLHGVRAEMFRSAVLRRRGEDGWEKREAKAFGRLRDLIVGETQLAEVRPQRDVIDDQIVWARSPVRLDLAGGWTDTPPYCIEHGGRVVNVAVDLNGQPPIQVFARASDQPEIVLRSIDLGVEERVRSYDQLASFSGPDSDFGLAKAALSLAGFLPRFHAGPAPASLEDQLRAFGGGIELSMLCAVPKGSGLGTSSVLAATILAALSNLCGLDWDATVLFLRALALEQLLTTGGGWQDQAGGIFRGVKLVETLAGPDQRPLLRWLPDELAGPRYANRSILLYYTGLTRMAKGILQEVVRGIFLNSPTAIDTLGEIGANAGAAAEALARCDYDRLATVIDQSWRLNQQLDPGTNTPEVQGILDRVAPWLGAAKLLGAGGGGYLLMFARDEAAASRIRDTLQASPPNPRARFVDFTVSPTGLQVTRS